MKSTRIHSYYIAAGLLAAIYVILVLRAAELFFASPLPSSVRPVPEPIRRGMILDSVGHELAITLDTVSVGARPGQIENPASVAEKISGILGMPSKELKQTLSQKDKSFLYIKRKIPESVGKKLEEMKIPGLDFSREPDRFYPNGHLASAVLGFTGVDTEGLSGIEYQYNADLTTSDTEQRMGRNISLTINAYIQYQLENVLGETFRETNSIGAVGIVSEVATGKVLAMTSLPDFDPNSATSFPKANHRNRAITDSFEPGSTFKIFTLAAIIHENLLDETRTYYCPGHFEHNGARTNCWSVHGKQTLEEVIQNSCNTGIIQAAWPVRVDRMHNTLQSLGFGSSTEMDLPAEASGFLPRAQTWDVYRKMSIPIGHGISATGIQLITAANAMANGGYLQKPMIVESITTADNKEVKLFSPRKKLRILNNQQGSKVRHYLERVVSSAGTGALASLGTEQKVCGKTGTSIKSDSTGYLKNKHIASFIGYFPCDNPEISIFIMFDEPSGAAYQGGSVAAPAFRKVLERIIANIHRGKEIQVKPMSALPWFQGEYSQTTMPNLIGKSKKEVLSIVYSHYPGDHTFHGAGYLSSQDPKPGAAITAPYSFSFSFSFGPGAE